VSIPRHQGRSLTKDLTALQYFDEMIIAEEWINLMLLKELPDFEGFLHFHDSAFTPFHKFSAELRRMIWETAIESFPTQVVDLGKLELPRSSIERQSSLIWNLFHANQESRKIIQEIYIFVSPGECMDGK
jgi:hypothetical protein